MRKLVDVARLVLTGWDPFVGRRCLTSHGRGRRSVPVGGEDAPMLAVVRRRRHPKLVVALSMAGVVAGCGARVDVDAACLVTGPVCDPTTMLFVGTCTLNRCAPDPPDASCTDDDCPIPNTTCDVKPGVVYIVACPDVRDW